MFMAPTVRAGPAGKNAGSAGAAVENRQRTAPTQEAIVTLHRITVEPSDRHVRVRHGDQTLAESDEALLLRETGCPTGTTSRPRTSAPTCSPRPPPPPTARTRATRPTGRCRTRRTRCGRTPDPKPEVREIKDHLCFYEVEVS
ncbi:hypothetical protein SFUMM280S_08602 [Streptomyces fumanus]